MMAAISSTVGMQAASQAALQQLRVQQAKQTAERAELAARSLRSQAEEQQRVADRAQENARSLYVQSDRAQSTAGQARQGLAALKSTSDMQASLFRTASQVSERMAEPQTQTQGAAPEKAAAPTPVLNTSGQLTGTVVNTSA